MTKIPLKIGITGSIGMGKTTIAQEIGKYNFPVWNSDEVVHFLYKKGNQGYNEIKNIVPEAALNNEIDRLILSKSILENSDVLNDIQKFVYPLVEIERTKFIKANMDKKIIVFDIPLLFETDCDKWLDVVIVATAPISVQKQRVLSRNSMTEKKFQYLLSRQIESSEKIRKADFVINTDVQYSDLLIDIKIILEKIQSDYN